MIAAFLVGLFSVTEIGLGGVMRHQSMVHGRPYTTAGSVSDMGVFARIMMGLAEQAPDDTTISIDATYLKAHRTASSLGLKKGAWASDRTDQRWDEYKTPRSYRR